MLMQVLISLKYQHRDLGPALPLLLEKKWIGTRDWKGIESSFLMS